MMSWRHEALPREYGCSPRRACPVGKNANKGDGMKGWIVFLTGLVFWGCASTRDVRILDRGVDRLQSQIDILQKENTLNKDQISELKAENQKLRADLSLQL